MMLSGRIHRRGMGMTYADPVEVVCGVINGVGYMAWVDPHLPDIAPAGDVGDTWPNTRQLLRGQDHI